MKILEVVGLTSRVAGVTVLDALSFTLEEGESLGLCGLEGAGKTACLRCLSGSRRAESGRVIFDGREVTGERPRTLARLGMAGVLDFPAPPWPFTAAEQVALALGWRRYGALAPLVATWPGPGTRGRALALLNRVGLAADAARPAARLPADRLKRLELAQALALEPRLLLLDEPLGALPREARPEMARLIAGLRAEGLSIVLAEWHPAVVEALVDRVTVLDRGALIA